MNAIRSFYGLEVDQSAPTAASTQEMVEVFELMKPRPSATPLLRIGGDRDGSYLVPDDLEGITACFSPGVNRIKYFEDFLADHYGIESHLCDFSSDVERFTTPLKPGLQTFRKKWLDIDGGPDSLHLEEWIADEDRGGDLLLQMDIEGAEFRNVLDIGEETLTKFRVVVLEIHGLGRMQDAGTLRTVIGPFFRRLTRYHTAVHAHPNNCCGEFAVPGTDITIPNVLELTLLRNDRFVPAPGVPALPHPLDVSRNVPRRAPLFLSEAWCDHQRPLESRVKMLEDTMRYRDEVGATVGDAELAAALDLTTASLRTLTELLPSPRNAELVEIAAGRPYQLSSAYGTSSMTGEVGQSRTYFFHTDFGPSQSIRVDLGQSHRLRRVHVINRRGGFQERARRLFVLLEGAADDQRVFPLTGPVTSADRSWQECAIHLPDVPARYVTITSPLNTALHFADLKVYAAAPGQSVAKRLPAMLRHRLGRSRRRSRVVTAAIARVRRLVVRG